MGRCQVKTGGSVNDTTTVIIAHAHCMEPETGGTGTEKFVWNPMVSSPVQCSSVMWTVLHNIYSNPFTFQARFRPLFHAVCMCRKRQRWYHNAMKPQLTEKILKLTHIHASVIFSDSLNFSSIKRKLKCIGFQFYVCILPWDQLTLPCDKFSRSPFTAIQANCVPVVPTVNAMNW